MKIICIHQSADLYGSDRSFLQVVEYMIASRKFSKITVILPRTGPLSEILIARGIEIIFMDLSLLSKTYLKKLQFGKILFPLFAFAKKRKLISQFDILYVNTSVILDFYVLAPFLSINKIIHIREIPTNWLSKILSFAISKSDSTVIFNSLSTKQSFSPFEKSVVIHNSFEGYEFSENDLESVKSSSHPLKILLIGRINSWKGQDFTIEALSKMSEGNFKLRIVGSTSTGNEDLLLKLKQKTQHLNITDKVEFIDFTTDPSQEYRNCDILVVPSIKPEPFGRIAIEAMSLGKPVIAANHGGLPEIIEHGINGFLFEPGNQDAFIIFIRKYLDNNVLLNLHGKKSRQLFVEKFSVNHMHLKLDDIFVL